MLFGLLRTPHARRTRTSSSSEWLSTTGDASELRLPPRGEPNAEALTSRGRCDWQPQLFSALTDNPPTEVGLGVSLRLHALACRPRRAATSVARSSSGAAARLPHPQHAERLLVSVQLASACVTTPASITRLTREKRMSARRMKRCPSRPRSEQ